MKIQRNYNLPNCNLVLEGLPDLSAPEVTSQRSSLMTLLTMECHFTGQSQPLIGGRDLLEALIQEVSLYGQALLSGVPIQENHRPSTRDVRLDPQGTHQHRLSIQSTMLKDAFPSTGQTLHIDLNTVEFFDLLEALDQVLADRQTLPDLGLHLAPIPKKLTSPSQSLTEQSTPATLGLVSFIAAAIALFMIPAPEIRRTVEPEPSPTQTNSSTSEPQTTPGDGQPNPQALESNFNSAPPITDPATLESLQSTLSAQIKENLQASFQSDSPLTYRVGVNAEGQIMGYIPQNTAAVEQIQKTPLPQLLVRLAPAQTQIPLPLAQFEITFQPDGQLQVKPWQAAPQRP